MMPADVSTSSCYLGELLEGFDVPEFHAACLPVRGITEDSRACQPGHLFMAVGRGVDKIPDAVRSGASAVLVEAGTEDAVPDPGVPLIPVHGLRANMGPIAARYYGEPSRHLRVIGITGTNGKTTCAHLLAQILPDCGYVGTLGYGRVNRLSPTGLTTPGAVDTQRILAELHASGCRTVVMEVSSHGLDQYRVDGTRFSVALFTNLGRDHLDYHKSHAAYAAAKARLFQFPDLGGAVINIQDPVGARLHAALPAGFRRLGFGVTGADLYADEVVYTRRGLSIRLVAHSGSVTLTSALFGDCNVENLLAVAGVLLQLGYSLEEAAQMLASVQPVVGRMQMEGRAGKPRVVIDYAHNPPGLESALRSLRLHFPDGRLYCVFGCGGDRDRGKRADMGRIAEVFADRVIVTDDNPRGEDARRICQDILGGVQRPDRVQVIHDRRAAIRAAIHTAGEQDLVLVAGKGAEQAQIVGDLTIPFSDPEVVRSILEEAP